MNSYTVTDRGKCRLVDGSMPLDAMVSITKGMPKNAVMDLHAARMLGVSVALGLPGDLEALCAQPDVAQAAYQRARAIGVGLSENAIRWLALGRQGQSSQTIFQRLTGRHLTDRESHPHDPGDFGRCRRLLEDVPELAGHLGELAEISEVWGRLVARWACLCAEMDTEAPNWRDGVGKSPRTYEIMKTLGC